MPGLWDLNPTNKNNTNTSLQWHYVLLFYNQTVIIISSSSKLHDDWSCDVNMVAPITWWDSLHVE